eukprot:scaffold53142_cov63-Phaeocystis_antarctica.AAC.1
MSLLHRPIARITTGGTPLASAAVAPPMRSECAPNSAGSSPTEAISVFTTARTWRVVKAAPVAGSRNNGVPAASLSGTGSHSKRRRSAS